MKVFALSLLIAVCGVAAFGEKKPNVEGTWQLKEILINGGSPTVMKVTQPSVYIFTPKYYSKTYVASDRARPEADDYTKASQELLVQIFVNGFEASAGTYEVTNGPATIMLLTLHPSVAKSPTDMRQNAWSTYTIRIDGMTLTLTPYNSSTGPNKKTISFKLTRVE